MENTIYKESYNATNELIKIAKLNKGDIIIVGCSTSEVVGNKIGTTSNIDVAKEIFNGINDCIKENGLYLACQCCEHLNRAIIVEEELAKKKNYEMVNVVPQMKAGGSFATIAYNSFNKAVAIEHIKADAGLDIGDTLIGMHLKDVAVPVRLSINKIGEAHLVAARTRLKFIGGERAVYNKDFM